MIRDIITNKWFIGAIALLIIFAGACYLWYQHDTAPYRQEAAESAKLLRQQEAAKKVDTVNEAVQAAEKAPAESNMQTAEKSINESTAEVETNTEAETQQADTLSVTAEVADVPTSPYGFGPYPEVPDDLRSIRRFKPVWEYSKWPNIRMGKSHELMDRVAIKLWNEDKRDWVGMGGDENNIYVNYPNTVYATWKETTDDDGNPIRYITSLSGSSAAVQRIKSNNIARLGRPGLKTAADIPSDIDVKLHSEDGINPYEYLNLPR